MNIGEELELTKQRQQGIARELSQLEEQKQQLLQELLRLDGEVRLLKRLKEDEGSGKG